MFQNYSRIPLHPNYRYPDKYEIEQAREDIGYVHYLPHCIFKDLVSLFSWYIYDESFKSALEQSVLKPEFKEFYSSLPEICFNEGFPTPLLKTFHTLKILSDSYDLRSLNNHRIVVKKETNLDSDPQTLSIINKLAPNLSRVDEERLQEFLKEFKQFLPKLPNSAPDKLMSNPMENYQELNRIKSSRMVRPDFAYRYAKKEEFIKKRVKEISDVPSFIYCEDASSSMQFGDNYLASLAFQILLCSDSRPVYYYRFAHQIVLKKLTSVEEKLESFTQEKTYYYTACNYHQLFNTIPKQGAVFLITDGEDLFNSSSLNRNEPISIVSSTENRELLALSQKTKGKFLII